MITDAEIRELREQVATLRRQLDSLQSSPRTGDKQLRIVTGVFETNVTVAASTQTKSYTGVVAQIRVYDAVDRDGLDCKEVLTRIRVVLHCPGDFVRGQTCYCIETPCGHWWGLPAGCEPMIPSLALTTIPS